MTPVPGYAGFLPSPAVANPSSQSSLYCSAGIRLNPIREVPCSAVCESGDVTGAT